MAAVRSISTPFPIYTDLKGEPLENGYIYIGEKNQNPEVVPITVYWDQALTISAAQPIRTIAGYPSYSGTPARLYLNAEYSTTVRNKNGALVYTSPVPTDFIDIVFPLSNISALLDYEDAEDETSVNVQGYYAQNDGGGGIFNWDSTINKNTANGGTIIDPSVSLALQGTGVGNGCWIRQYSGAVNVKWFGAKDDDSTDNSTVYTNIIDALDEGSTIEWEVGGVYVGSFISTKSFILKGNGANIKAVPGQDYIIKFNGSLGSYSALSTAPAYGDTSLDGVSGLSGDTYLKLYSGTERASDNAPVNYEIVKVKSDGTLYDKVYSDQDGGTPTYAVIAELSDIEVDGFNMSLTTEAQTGVFIQYAINVKVSNIKMIGGQATTVSLRDAYNITVHHIQRIKPTATGSGQGYNVQHWICKYIKTHSIYGEETRHEYEQDSCYVADIKKVISIGTKDSAITLAHNGFGGTINVDDCILKTDDTSYAIVAAAAGFDPSSILIRDVNIKNIEITNAVSVITNVSYVGIYFQYRTNNIYIDNVNFINISGGTFDYVGAAYNPNYFPIRLIEPDGLLSISNIFSEEAGTLIYVDEIPNGTSQQISIKDIQVNKYEYIVRINSVEVDYEGALTIKRLATVDTAGVYGAAYVYLTDSTNRLRNFTIEDVNIIPFYAKLVIITSGAPVPLISAYREMDIVKGNTSLNGVASAGTITQEQYIGRGAYGIWGSTSKSLSATEPFERPISSTNIFGILNYGSGTLTIPANSDTVDNTSDILIQPTYLYEFQANSAGTKWTLMRKISGVTLS